MKLSDGELYCVFEKRFVRANYKDWTKVKIERDFLVSIHDTEQEARDYIDENRKKLNKPFIYVKHQIGRR